VKLDFHGGAHQYSSSAFQSRVQSAAGADTNPRTLGQDDRYPNAAKQAVLRQVHVRLAVVTTIVAVVTTVVTAVTIIVTADTEACIKVAAAALIVMT
jgi:hypothetical protein